MRSTASDACFAHSLLWVGCLRVCTSRTSCLYVTKPVCLYVTNQLQLFHANLVSVWKGGQGLPRILKISAKKGCFLSFEWDKPNFTTLLPPHPRKILENLPRGTSWKKNLPTPMANQLLFITNLFRLLAKYVLVRTQARDHVGAFGGQFPNKYFVPPKMCCFWQIIKAKALPPWKCILPPPIFKTWLRAWSCLN